MRAALHFNESTHQQAARHALSKGLDALGIAWVNGRVNECTDCDFACTWGVRQEKILRSPTPTLVLERGYVGDRFFWTSMGWDGLNGRARFPVLDDDSRWRAYHSDALKPRRNNLPRVAVIMGQITGDAALRGVHIGKWYRDSAKILQEEGWEVRFRPHPGGAQLGYGSQLLPGVSLQKGSLQDALEQAGLVVTYNSNSGVDAALAGVPVHSEDMGSMAWPVSSHNLSQIAYPRLKWAIRMSWTQWMMKEIADGSAIKTALTCLET